MEKRFASPAPEDVLVIIRDRLQRRLSAPKRIGCLYRVDALGSAAGVDLSDWLPGFVEVFQENSDLRRC